VIQKSDLMALRERVQQLDRPVLSLYADVNPARDPNAQAVHIRVKNTLKAADGVSDAVAQKVLQAFQGRTQGHARVVFASPERVESIDLDLDFVDDAGRDRVTMQLGEPYFTPLLAAIDEHPPYVVACASRDAVHVFEVFLGQIEKLFSETRETIADEQDDVEPSKDRRPAAVSGVNTTQARSPSTASNRGANPHVADRGDASVQLADERIEHSQRLFYLSVGRKLQQLLGERDICHVLLLGPDRSAHLLLSALPGPVAKCVEAVLPPVGAVPTESALLGLVQEKIKEIDRLKKDELVSAIVERGVTGLDDCLRALQQNRLYRIAVPEDLSQRVFMNRHTEEVASTEDEVRASQADGDIVEAELGHVLPRLAEKWGAQLEFVRGDARRRLDEIGGIGGLTRF